VAAPANRNLLNVITTRAGSSSVDFHTPYPSLVSTTSGGSGRRCGFSEVWALKALLAAVRVPPWLKAIKSVKTNGGAPGGVFTVTVTVQVPTILWLSACARALGMKGASDIKAMLRIPNANFFTGLAPYSVLSAITSAPAARQFRHRVKAQRPEVVLSSSFGSPRTHSVHHLIKSPRLENFTTDEP
jgi:hypothetical protein